MGADVVKETRLPARYERLAKVVDTMNCGLVGSGLDGSVIFANERLLAWMQSDWDDIVGRPAVEFGVPAHGEQLAAEIEALQEGDLRGRMLVMCRKDGTTFPALFIPQRLFGDDGELEATFSIVVDLASVYTAKRVGVEDPHSDLTSVLEHVVRKFRSIAVPPTPSGPDLGHPDLRDLSPREREVLERLMLGDRVPRIGERLFISHSTVRNHLKSIFRKVGVSSQGALIEHVRGLA